MDATRILIAMSSDISMQKLCSILIDAGYGIIDQTKDGPDCLRKIRALEPDLVILDYVLPSMNGLEISRVAMEERLCDVMLITTVDQDEAAEDLRAEAGFVSLVKPVNKALLIGSIELMMKNRKKIRQLETEIDQLKTSLDTRKEVEKAKGLLMTRLGMSESEAFKRIQKQSMDRGVPMKEIAKAIILAYDV